MEEVDLKSFNNSWYKPGSIIKRVIWHIFSNIFINSMLPFPMFIKIFVLKTFGAKIGEGFVIKPNVNIKFPWYLEIGNDVWIGENVWIDNFILVKIENNVCVSQGAMLLTGNHDFTKSSFDLIIKPIFLKEGAWVGAKTIVCPGVTLEKKSVLTVGSIATKDLAENGIYQGNPAQHIKIRKIID
jgi:putative colanic acid biosynthesis acetyltransferase WcaF